MEKEQPADLHLIIEDSHCEKWYFTFMQRQPEKNSYVIATGTYGEAREKMFAKYGTAWAFQYSEKQFTEPYNQAVKFHLTCIDEL